MRYEALYYSHFDLIYTLSEQDRYGLHIFSPELGIEVIPAAVDVPQEVMTNRYDSGKRILFVGSFFHPPNKDAVHFFLLNIFPLVLKHLPDTEFFVAGKGAQDCFKQYESTQVRLLGFVDDLHELYKACAVVVIPLRFGGGVKIKTIEAMANGCSIVSTSIGVEGTGALDQQHALIADAPEEFADKLIRLLVDSSFRDFLGKNAWELAKERFSWESRSQKLEFLFERLATQFKRQYD